MIVEYLRPKTLDEALKYLDREQPKTIPLGGGSLVSKITLQDVAVVDLQDLQLNEIEKTGGNFVFGATASLSEIQNFINSDSFSEIIQIQAGKNIRNSGTIAGLICSADGRSTLLTWLLALDAHLIWAPGNKDVSLGNWLATRGKLQSEKLITKVIVPNVEFHFSSIGRSPRDLPVLCCAIAKWESGRMRIAIGGFGSTPILVLDGKTTDDFTVAIKSALHDASDQWASAEYRMEVGVKLGQRLYNELLINDEERSK